MLSYLIDQRRTEPIPEQRQSSLSVHLSVGLAANELGDPPESGNFQSDIGDPETAYSGKLKLEALVEPVRAARRIAPRRSRRRWSREGQMGLGLGISAWLRVYLESATQRDGTVVGKWKLDPDLRRRQWDTEES